MDDPRRGGLSVRSGNLPATLRSPSPSRPQRMSDFERCKRDYAEDITWAERFCEELDEIFSFHQENEVGLDRLTNIIRDKLGSDRAFATITDSMDRPELPEHMQESLNKGEYTDALSKLCSEQILMPKHIRPFLDWLEVLQAKVKPKRAEIDRTVAIYAALTAAARAEVQSVMVEELSRRSTEPSPAAKDTDTEMSDATVSREKTHSTDRYTPAHVDDLFNTMCQRGRKYLGKTLASGDAESKKFASSIEFMSKDRKEEERRSLRQIAALCQNTGSLTLSEKFSYLPARYTAFNEACHNTSDDVETERRSYEALVTAYKKLDVSALSKAEFGTVFI